jgi:hypothetical protein
METDPMGAPEVADMLPDLAQAVSVRLTRQPEQYELPRHAGLIAESFPDKMKPDHGAERWPSG